MKDRSKAARLPSIALLVVAALLLPGSTRGEDPPVVPLHNEDIVRMLVEGRPARDVIHEIETLPVEFDLTADMLLELRSVQVPESVLAAMQARSAAIERARSAAQPKGPPPPALRIHLRSDKDGATPSALLLSDWGNDALATKLKLDLRGEERELADVALFVACTTAEHVPDQWRATSPLGRDFVAPKHHMLLFQPGAVHLMAQDVPSSPLAMRRTRADGTPVGYLELRIPEELTVEMSPDEPHDLLLGIAVRVKGNWHPLASARKKHVATGPGGLDLSAVIEKKGSDEDVEVRFLRDRDD